MNAKYRIYVVFRQDSIGSRAIHYSVPSTFQPMIETLPCLGILIRPGLRGRRDLVLENLALLQQLAVLKKQNRVLRLKTGRPSILADALSNLGSLAIGPFSACEAGERCDDLYSGELTEAMQGEASVKLHRLSRRHLPLKDFRLMAGCVWVPYFAGLCRTLPK
jgi:hypothetical protein